MRIREIKWHLDEGLADFKIGELNGVKLPDGTGGVALSGATGGRVRRFLGHVAELQAFRIRAQSLSQHGVVVFAHDDNELSGEQSVITLLKNQLSALVQEATLLRSALAETIESEEPEYLISVKLPQCNSLQDLAHTITELVETFDTPARRLFGEGVAFSGVDRGSSWVEFVAASSLVLTFTTALIRTCFSFVDKRAKAEEAAAVLRSLDVTTGTLEASLDSLVKELAVQLVEGLKPSDVEPEKVNETIPLTINAIRVLGDLYMRGTEIRLAFSAPKEQEAKVPTANELSKVVQAVAQLRAHND